MIDAEKARQEEILASASPKQPQVLAELTITVASKAGVQDRVVKWQKVTNDGNLSVWLVTTDG